MEAPKGIGSAKYARRHPDSKHIVTPVGVVVIERRPKPKILSEKKGTFEQYGFNNQHVASLIESGVEVCSAADRGELRRAVRGLRRGSL